MIVMVLKMKHTLSLFVLLLASLCVHAQEAYVLYDREGNRVSLETLIAKVEGKTHVFFGEHHNNPISHWLQLSLVKSLHEKYGDKLVLGAEMFEADDQLLLDEYFADLIRQSSFEREARLWPNYKTDYKPLVEFAKANKLRFVATNVPRRYANAVFYHGPEILESFGKEAKSYLPSLPLVVDTTLSAYRDIIAMGNGHGGQYMVHSQALKDATMAHFILKNSKLGGSDQTLFLHLNGSFHSDHYQGILNYLPSQVSRKSILTISTVAQSEVSELDEKFLGIADFIICVDASMTTTH